MAANQVTVAGIASLDADCAGPSSVDSLTLTPSAELPEPAGKQCSARCALETTAAETCGPGAVPWNKLTLHAFMRCSS